jgi:hypothetical protein
MLLNKITLSIPKSRLKIKTKKIFKWTVARKMKKKKVTRNKNKSLARKRFISL